MPRANGRPPPDTEATTRVTAPPDDRDARDDRDDLGIGPGMAVPTRRRPCGRWAPFAALLAGAAAQAEAPPEGPAQAEAQAEAPPEGPAHAEAPAIVEYWESPDALQPVAEPCVTFTTGGRAVGTWPLAYPHPGGGDTPTNGNRSAAVDVPVGVPLALALHTCGETSPFYETTLTIPPTAAEPQIRLTGGPIGFDVRTVGSAGEAPPPPHAGGAASTRAVTWLLRGLGATLVGGLGVALVRRLRRPAPSVLPLGRRTRGALFGLPGFPQRSVAWVVPEEVRAELLVATVEALAAWGPVLVLPRASTRALLAEVPTAGAWQMADPRPDPRDVVRAAARHHAAILVEGPEALSPPLEREAPGAVLEELARIATGPLLVIARPGEPIPPRLRALVFERDEAGFRVDGARVEWPGAH